MATLSPRSMRHLHSEIEINAPPERVWDVLVDFASYPEWNPFVTRASGPIHRGSRLKITVGPPGRRSMGFSPTVLVANRPHELRWLGRVGFKGLFDGEQSFVLEALPKDRTRVVQHEKFSGILVPVMGPGLYRASQEGFEALTRALKDRVESRRR